jgi:5-methylcytosine-specific restriction endonuclease McrA
MSRVANSSRGDKAKADKLFSVLVRERRECEHCGERTYYKLQCAHIISRHFSHTRCDPDNAFCLCAGCHHFFTDHPVEFGVFVLSKRGEDGYAALRAKSQLRTKVDWAAEVERLRGLV